MGNDHVNSVQKAVFLGLTADKFRHTLDYDATRSLKQVPGLDLAVRTLLGSMAEQIFYLENVATSILVGENQLPDYFRLLAEAAQILDLEPPQLYVRQHPMPNAYTLAMRGKQPFIVIHTALLDLLTPQEVQAVIAHELGHLKCDHGVYLSLANLMVLATSQLPVWGTILAQGLQNQLLTWVRCAEFSCDRAALLVAQDPKVVMSVLMKLAGGSPKLAPLLNLDAFIAQAQSYDRAATQLGDLIKQAHTAPLTHPLPVLRAREIDRWAASPDYQKLLQTAKMGYINQAPFKGEWRNW
jgi:Zn-dependent protease with chaperone function